jgi:hypothetical protein
MIEYKENQHMPWWNWIESLWNSFDRVGTWVARIESEPLSILVGVSLLVPLILICTILTILMLIPHTWSWLNLSLIEWTDRVGERMSHSDVTIVRTGSMMTILLTIAIVSPFFVTALPYTLYRHIKGDTSSKTTREEWDRLEEERDTLRAEAERHREAMMTFLHNTYEPKDFKPIKRIMVHKLDQGIRKQTFVVSPGIYTTEVDHSNIITRDPWGGDNDNYRPMESYAEHVNREIERLRIYDE